MTSLTSGRGRDHPRNNDTVYGQDGNDKLYGGAGTDGHNCGPGVHSADGGPNLARTPVTTGSRPA